MARGKTQLGNMAFGAGAIAIASAADQSAPAVIQLLAIGANRSRNGKPPVVTVDDRAHAERIVQATVAWHSSADIVVDYDHQSMFGARAGVGGRAPAAGWMKRVYADDQGVFAEVDWTDAAAASLGAREYRFLSPVFTHDKSGRPIAIINAALTNTPSLDLAAVASAFSTEEGSASMNMANVAKALGLGEEASEEEILRAIANLGGAATMTAIATALGATAGADLVAVATALKAQAGNPDPTKFVSIATVNEMQTSIQSLQGRVDEMSAERRTRLIDEAQKTKFLTPAMATHAGTITDDVALASFLGSLPENKLGQPIVEGDPEADKSKLTEEEVAVCSATGMSHEEFLARRATEQGGAN